MNKKGFTLIELLAVILILAIIALIAVPIVSNVINESKEKAAKVTAQNYVKAIEDKIAKDKLLGRKNFLSGRTYQVEEDTELIDKDNGNLSQIDGETVLDIDNSFYLKDVINVKGNAPTDGYIVCEDSKVEEVAFIINGLLVTGTAEQIKNGTLDVDKFSGASNIASVGISNPKSGLLGGETHQLNVTVTTTDGQEPGKKTKYSSSNTSVATISNKGLITAVNEGTTTITVKAGMKRATFILTVYNGSLLGYVGTLETSGIYQTTVNNVTYDLNVIVLNGNQTISSNTNYGTLDDCASGTDTSDMATRMVVVKVNGDYTVNSGVTVGPTYNENYGGPKGFMLYVTGTLTNNGTIDNSHGAYATGENVYLYKNSNNTYEYIPAVGAGAKTSGVDLAKRATGGGGAANGAPGTSFSGGSGGSKSAVVLPSEYGGNGARGAYKAYNYEYAGGAGNPAGCSDRNNVCGKNGTGGLLVIYANEFENNGNITAKGQNGVNSSAGEWAGAASGGGSINIFINQTINSSQLLNTPNTIYNNILGSVDASGGKNYNNAVDNNAAGDGTVNIGEIRNGQYYDLKEIIQQDMAAYQESLTKKGTSILDILNKYPDLVTGYWTFKVNENTPEQQIYQVHLYVYDSQVWSNTNTFGELLDCASGESSDNMAQRMVIVKVNGDLTNNGTIVPIYNETYGGPKGFVLYVTGKLTNNGTIDNSHGAYAVGQDVYLWKNSNNTYEYIPAVGAGAKTSGVDLAKRATGGGGAANGAPGTSFSGGSGGSKSAVVLPSEYGGNGARGAYKAQTYEYAGGAGNPAGCSDRNNVCGKNGTGGLLVIYANEFENNGNITAKGQNGVNSSAWEWAGAASGGGSINIFINQTIDSSQLVNTTDTIYNNILGSVDASGGKNYNNAVDNNAAGDGTVNIGRIVNGQYQDLRQIIEQAKQ